MDECRTGDLVLESTSEEAVIPDGVGYDGDDVSVSDGVGVMGEGEVLPDDGSSVDISGYIDVNGVSNRPLDLRARMAVYDGAGVIVIRGGGGVSGWWWCWSGVYEVKCDDCGDSSDGGGDGVIHGAKIQKNQPYGAGLRLVRPPCVERAGLF